MILFLIIITVFGFIPLLLDKFNDYADRKYEASMNYEKMENQIPETTRKMGASKEKIIKLSQIKQLVPGLVSTRPSFLKLKKTNDE